MGYSLGWVAVRGTASDALLGLLGMRGTGAMEELPESDSVGAALPGGWYVVVARAPFEVLVATSSAASPEPRWKRLLRH